MRYRPRRVDSASLKFPSRLISLYERPRRLQSIKKLFRLLCEAEAGVGADDTGADANASDADSGALAIEESVFAID